MNFPDVDIQVASNVPNEISEVPTLNPDKRVIRVDVKQTPWAKIWTTVLLIAVAKNGTTSWGEFFSNLTLMGIAGCLMYAMFVYEPSDENEE